MARRGKDNDHTKSGQLRRRGRYRIQHVMMMMMMMCCDLSITFFVNCQLSRNFSFSILKTQKVEKRVVVLISQK